MTELTQDKILDLLCSSKTGDTQCLDSLIENFKPMVSSIARGYFLVGGDDEDLVQEGMIGLYKAIQTYDKENKATFSTFAYLCILRQVQTAVRASLRKSRVTLSRYLPISNQGMIVIDSGEESGIYLVSDEMTPEETLIQQEQKQELSDIIKKQLSEFEYSVLGLYLKGYSQSDISHKLKKDIKSVSNAIARMRLKLQSFFGGENVSSTLS